MTTSKAPSDELFPTSEAASYTCISDATLAGYRSRGIGPAFLKFGNRVFYRRRDLDEWIASRRVRSTAEARGLESHARSCRQGDRAKNKCETGSRRSLNDEAAVA